jgi:hypothetical protein
MSLGPIDIAGIIARLKAEASTLRQVAGAAEATAAQKASTASLPGAFVYLERESAPPKVAASGVHLQRVTARIAVLLAVRNYRDARGGDAMQDLRAHIADVRAALIGWKPDDAITSVDFRDGRLISFDDAVVWWQESFDCDYLARTP